MTQEKNISAFYSEMNAFNKRIILVADEIQNIERIQMFRDICTIHIDDDISFTFSGIDDIREDDEYSGYHVSLSGNYPPMAVPLKIDITTGDKITPREMVYQFNLMFE